MRSARRHHFGGLADDILSAIGAGAQAGFAQTDPDTAETIQLLRDIISHEANSPSNDGSSFRLADLKPYLLVYRFDQEHPWLPYAAAGAAILALVGAGVVLGMVGKKCRL